jgi:hypothetical protein
MNPERNWKTLVWIIGGIAGLATGLTAAALIIKRKENSGTEFKLNSGEGFKIGMSVVNLLKQITDNGLKK